MEVIDRPVVLLDIDGVVTTSRMKHAMGSETYINPAQVEMLNKLVERTNAVVVISSSWRFDADVRERLRTAGFRGDFHERWRTGEYGQSRGHEIQAWLDVEDPENYVILDDDRGTLPSQRARHVRPRSESGLFDSHIEEAVEILADADYANRDFA